MFDQFCGRRPCVLWNVELSWFNSRIGPQKQPVTLALTVQSFPLSQGCARCASCRKPLEPLKSRCKGSYFNDSNGRLGCRKGIPGSALSLSDYWIGPLQALPFWESQNGIQEAIFANIARNDTPHRKRLKRPFLAQKFARRLT